MKKLFLFLCLGFTALMGFAQQKDYLLLEGKLGDMPIRMSLIHSKSAFEPGKSLGYQGYYSYDHQGQPKAVLFKSFSDDHLDLIYYGKYDPITDEADEEFFSGKLKKGSYKGEWTDGKQKLKFSLKEAKKGQFTDLAYLKNSILVPVTHQNPLINVEGSFDLDWYLPKDEKIRKGLIEVMELDNFSNFDSFSQMIFSQFEQEYRDEIDDYIHNIEDTDNLYTSSWNYTHSISLSPMLDNSKYLVMDYSSYDYTGGAHGYYYSLYYTYNKEIEKWLTAGDVFNLNEKTAIEKVLDSELRKQYNIPEGADLDEGENSIFISKNIPFSDNFTLNQTGVTFHYSLYELTPYVYGLFELSVPYDQLRPYLNPGFSY